MPSWQSSGLGALADGRLKLPAAPIPTADRRWLESLTQRIPPIPTTATNGHRIISLAESWESIANPNEFPQLYSVVPFGIYGVGLADLELARDTWRSGAFDDRCQKESLGWKYGSIEVARLGLANEAQRYCLEKLLYPPRMRYQTAHYGDCCPFTGIYHVKPDIGQSGPHWHHSIGQG